MKKHSCGALLYTIYNNSIYIILGMEKGVWFPFKGTREKGETNEQAAIREIYEETCGITKIDRIELNCNFSTKRKHYHIGLIRVPPSIVNQFYKIKEQIYRVNGYNDNCYKYLEKSNIKMFPLSAVKNINFHEVTKIPIKFYYDHLKMIENNLRKKKLTYSSKSSSIYHMCLNQIRTLTF